MLSTLAKPGASVPTPQHVKKSDFLFLLLTVCTGCVIGIWAAIFLRAELGHDQAWYLYCASRVLHGVKLYGPELIDTNPPFPIWFHILPLWIAQAFHLHENTAFAAFFLLLFAGSACWSLSLFKRLLFNENLWAAGFALSLPVALLLPVQGFNIGQREHFLTLLVLPYTLLAAARFAGAPRGISRAEAACIGLIAGLGICLKPQQALLVVSVELIILLRRRSLRANLDPSILAILATGVGYVAATELFARNYLTTVLPLLRDTYWGFDIRYRTIVHVFDLVILGQMACAAVLFLRWQRLRSAPLVAVWLAGSLGALLACIQQHKAFPYHIIPALAFMLLAACFLAGETALQFLPARPAAAPSEPRAGIPLLLASLAALAAAVLTAFVVPRPAPTVWFHSRELAQAFAPYPPGTPVAYLSFDLSEMPYVLDHHLIWAQREPHMFMLPAILKSEGLVHDYRSRDLSPQRVREISSIQRTWITEDLARFRPQAVAVWECGYKPCTPPGSPTHFNLLDWLQESPAFRLVWQNYTYQHTYGESVDVYVRKPDAR